MERAECVDSQSALVNNLLGGWEVNAIASATSGQPYSVTVAGDIANIGNTFVMPNLVGNPTPQQRSPSAWFNTSAFQSPPADTFGNLGRYTLRSNWFRDLDLSVFKTFPLTEKTRLEFRAEAFNITNTPVFATPDSGVTDRAFGTVSSIANSPRQIQFALKIQF